jgi:hypothetical protein
MGLAADIGSAASCWASRELNSWSSPYSVETRGAAVPGPRNAGTCRSTQHGSGLEAVTAGMVTSFREFVALRVPAATRSRKRWVIPVEITQPFGLQAIGDHAYSRWRGR